MFLENVPDWQKTMMPLSDKAVFLFLFLNLDQQSKCVLVAFVPRLLSGVY